jgi:hypothetical protein
MESRIPSQGRDLWTDPFFIVTLITRLPESPRVPYIVEIISPLLFGFSRTVLSAQPATPASTQGISTNRSSNYLAAMTQRLSINSRNREPFGFAQDLSTAKSFRSPGPKGPAERECAEVVASLAHHGDQLRRNIPQGRP